MNRFRWPLAGAFLAFIAPFFYPFRFWYFDGTVVYADCSLFAFYWLEVSSGFPSMSLALGAPKNSVGFYFTIHLLFSSVVGLIVFLARKGIASAKKDAE